MAEGLTWTDFTEGALTQYVLDVLDVVMDGESAAERWREMNKLHALVGLCLRGELFAFAKTRAASIRRGRRLEREEKEGADAEEEVDEEGGDLDRGPGEQQYSPPKDEAEENEEHFWLALDEQREALLDQEGVDGMSATEAATHDVLVYTATLITDDLVVVRELAYRRMRLAMRYFKHDVNPADMESARGIARLTDVILQELFDSGVVNEEAQAKVDEVKLIIEEELEDDVMGEEDGGELKGGEGDEEKEALPEDLEAARTAPGVRRVGAKKATALRDFMLGFGDVALSDMKDVAAVMKKLNEQHLGAENLRKSRKAERVDRVAVCKAAVIRILKRFGKLIVLMMGVPLLLGPAAAYIAMDTLDNWEERLANRASIATAQDWVIACAFTFLVFFHVFFSFGAMNGVFRRNRHLRLRHIFVTGMLMYVGIEGARMRAQSTASGDGPSLSEYRFFFQVSGVMMALVSLAATIFFLTSASLIRAGGHKRHRQARCVCCVRACRISRFYKLDAGRCMYRCNPCKVMYRDDDTGLQILEEDLQKMKRGLSTLLMQNQDSASVQKAVRRYKYRIAKYERDVSQRKARLRRRREREAKAKERREWINLAARDGYVDALERRAIERGVPVEEAWRRRAKLRGARERPPRPGSLKDPMPRLF